MDPPAALPAKMEGIESIPPSSAPLAASTSTVPSGGEVRKRGRPRKAETSTQPRVQGTFAKRPRSPSGFEDDKKFIKDPKKPANKRQIKSEPIFVSALNFPLQPPALPPTTSQPLLPSSTAPVAANPNQNEPRKPRQSKIAANLKLENASIRQSSSSPGPSDANGTRSVTPNGTGLLPGHDPSLPHFSKNPLAEQSSRPRAPKLDFTTVKTLGPRVPPPRTRQRAFGLTEAPTFYPTKEEFRDTMEYIRWCAEEGGASEFGICKIVPPEGWQPPFVMDTETFKFGTRLMRVNSLEAKSRAKINFLEQLYMYHRQQGNRQIAIPVVDGKEVDLWSLRRETTAMGGYGVATRNRKWSELARKIGFGPHYSDTIQHLYSTIILPFDEFSARAKGSATKQAQAQPQSQPTSPALSNTDKPSPGMRPSPLSNFTSASTPSAPPKLPPSSLRDNTTASGSGSDPGSAIKGDAEAVRRALDFEDGDSSLSEAESESEELKRAARKGEREANVAKNAAASSNGRMGGRSMRTAGGGLKPSNNTKIHSTRPADWEKGDYCEVCQGGHDETKILLCDGCDAGYHIYCLDPPLSAVPKNESWFCSTCLFGTGTEFGFDEGEDHSLHSFQQRDSAFRDYWFANHPPQPPIGCLPSTIPNGVTQKLGGFDVSEHDVEEEFWRLVESQTETVEVEYGADVHGAVHGSAAPTYETHPNDPYSIDQWNLNNMPILPGSVLRYIKQNISGMTVPWIYVGFIFSAFCWHNEDHYTSSVNYMHFGETKTWYGVPGDDYLKFEAAIKAEAPDLFEQQPALLYQLVTLMNPGRLKAAGVRVFSCDQRANEFVITFPKAYHAGFNHGMNYNEAVNFARTDWLSHGLDCVKNYQQHAKPPVFCHNELLCTIAGHSGNVDTAVWLQKSLREMVEKEIEIRNRVRSGPSPPIEVVREEDLPTEDDYQCSTCKTFSYLSQITCSCTSAVSCIEHAAQLCGCPSDKQTLRLRFSDSNLIILQDNIDEKAAVPTAWKSRLQKILKDSEAPPLKSLRALVSEAERSSYQLPEFPPLKAYVDRANELVAEASLFLARKSTGRKTGGGRSRKSTAASADVEMEDAEESTKPTRTIEAVVNLLQGVDQLGFDASEIVDLRAVLESAQDFRSRATSVLSLPDAEQDLPSLEALHVTGASLKLEIPELAPLSLIIRRLSLLRELDEVEERDLEIKDVEAYLETAKEVGIPAEHEFVVDLEKKKLAGCAWRGETRQTFTAGSTDLATLERLLKRADEVPVERELFVQLKQLRAKAVDWDKTAKALIKSAMTQPQLEDDAKPSTIADVRRLLKRVDTKSVCTVVIPEVEVLREEVAWHEAWSRELYAAFPDVPKVKLLSHLQAMQDNIVARTHPDDDMPAPIEADTEPAAAESKDDAESDGEGEKEGEGEEQEQAPRALLPFSCVCRGPEVLPMLTCKKCGATYHGDCVGVSPRSVKAFKRYRCITCDPKKIEAPRLLKPKLIPLSKIIVVFAQRRILFPPPEWRTLSDIVERSARLVILLHPSLTPAQPKAGPIDRAKVLYLKHQLRKIEQFAIDVQIPDHLTEKGGQDVRSCILAAIRIVDKRGKGPIKRTRSRKPKWEITREVSRTDDASDPNQLRRPVHCLCDVSPSRPDLTISCSGGKCGQKFHRQCVFIPPDDTSPTVKCPICCVKSGTRYAHAQEMRLQMTEDRDAGNNLYVDVKATLALVTEMRKHSWPPTSERSITLYATQFIPGERSEQEVADAARQQQQAQRVYAAPPAPDSYGFDHSGVAYSDYTAHQHLPPSSYQSSSYEVNMARIRESARSHLSSSDATSSRPPSVPPPLSFDSVLPAPAYRSLGPGLP